MSTMSTKNTRPDRAKKVLAALRARYPHPHTHLDAETAWQLLVATVLAAQCTDARVNIVTADLFKKYPTIKDFAAADLAAGASSSSAARSGEL